MILKEDKKVTKILATDGREVIKRVLNDKIYYQKLEYVMLSPKLWWDSINNTGTGHSDTATTWTDLSGNGCHGTLTGYSAAPQWDNGLYVDGINNFVKAVKEATNMTTPFTIEYTFRPTTIPTKPVADFHFVNMSGEGFVYADVDVRASGIQRYGLMARTADNSKNGWMYGNINPNDYLTSGQLITFTITATTTNGTVFVPKNYINGIYIPADTNAGEAAFCKYGTAANRLMAIGKDNIPAATNGRIYSLRVHNEVLTSEQVANNYAVDKARFGIE